ncbi:penicillin-binding protein 1B [Lacimicrobium alkaliphilum]|uniref:Penicillin-binding protein 1B n=1 Tax=Lacimicrobium alkaliphilum TaxID=1526571 RepID=A0ABQ1QZ49_9ALTE|nr:penicillin-binding protein 1B [Lacimicrobium alkaliphilum]GGD50826.1 penicillin-binding protein 1B [Lacimicrobium alkaliphilum]
MVKKNTSNTSRKAPTRRANATKSNAGKSRASNSKARPSLAARIWSWSWRNSWKFMLVGLLCLSAYGLYLDASIKARFGGNKWQVPAQIYARPYTLNRGQQLTISEVVEELKWLSYRPVAQVQSSGQYAVKGNQLFFYRRDALFAEGPQTGAPVRLTFTRGELSDIRFNGRATEQVRLEPYLVTRFTNSSGEDRMLVQLEDVPQELITMLLQVEDRDFYQHHGVAPLAILRALVANISAGRAVQGGSTLTQQLIKNLFLSNEKTLIRKANEALMSLVIELRYSKDEILEAYLNEVFLGQNGINGVHGFGLASYFYFDRPLNELTVPEMALLVGMIKGPSYYNPRRNEERALERRNLVLRLLFEAQAIAPQQYQAWLQTPLTLRRYSRHNRSTHPAFMDKVREELQRVLPDVSLQQAGIKIFTTLDPLAQRKAESVISEGIERISKQRELPELQGAMVVTDIASGGIRAMVGDKNTHYQGFNRAMDARRPIGSLIKPAVYLTALEQPFYYNLGTPIADKPIQLKSSEGKLWAPQNADKTFRQQVPLLQGLSESLNVPTVTLGMELGLDAIAGTIKRLGVHQHVPRYPAMTLGALSLSPLQVNQLYQTIANEGGYIPVHSISAVVDNDGRVLWQHQQVARQRADRKAVYLLNYALNRVTREGTAKALKQRFPQLHLAGKTGTTNDYRDSWYSGFDRNHLATIWLGTDDNKSTGLAGASGALPLYMDYLQQSHPKSLSRPFPQGLGIAHFDLQSGTPVQPGCAGSISVPAVTDALPAPADCLSTERKKPEKKEKSWWQKLFGGE